MQIRVYAKPSQITQSDSDEPTEVIQSSSQHFTPVHQQRFINGQRPDSALPNGLPPKRFRPHGSADNRHSSSAFRQQIRQMQAEARLREAYTAAARSAEGSYRGKRIPYDDLVVANPSTQLPSVSAGPHSSRRVPLFSFKRNSTGDLTLGSSQAGHGQREGPKNRKNFVLPQSAGARQSKGQVRFQEEELGPGGGDYNRQRQGDSTEYLNLLSRHVEPRSTSQTPQRPLGTYSVAEHPPRAVSCKPSLPRSNTVTGSSGAHEIPNNLVHGRVNSAVTRSGRVREWLSVDSVPASYKHRPRPSTVSSTSSSTRSRDISSAKQRLAGSSRVSSASVKAASDPGPDLDSMDLVTLNLMARSAKGPSRYRYLAKLRSLNLNTPRPLS